MIAQNLLPLSRGEPLQAAQALLPLLRSNEGERDLGHAKDSFEESAIFPEFEARGRGNHLARKRRDQFDHGLDLGHVGMVLEILNMLHKFKVLAKLVQVNTMAPTPSDCVTS